MCRHGAKGHVLVVKLVVLCWWQVVISLRVFSNLNNSMKLRKSESHPKFCSADSQYCIHGSVWSWIFWGRIRWDAFPLTPSLSSAGKVHGHHHTLLPSPSSPSLYTSPEECKAISPRQALTLSPQMFSQAIAASCRPGTEIPTYCFEGSIKPYCAVLASAATHGASPRAGRAL